MAAYTSGWSSAAAEAPVSMRSPERPRAAGLRAMAGQDVAEKEHWCAVPGAASWRPASAPFCYRCSDTGLAERRFLLVREMADQAREKILQAREEGLF